MLGLAVFQYLREALYILTQLGDFLSKTRYSMVILL